MNATAKFYTGFFIVLALIVAVSFAIGYRTGFEKAVRSPHTASGFRK